MNRMRFMEVVHVSEHFTRASFLSGVFGLGFEWASKSGITPFVSKAHKRGLLAEDKISFWFNKHFDPLNAGQVMLGGVNTGRFKG